MSLVDNGLGGFDIVMSAGVFSTTAFLGGTSLFTGIPVISDMQVTAANQWGTFTNNYTHTNFVGGNELVGPYLGGVIPLSGQLVLWALGAPAAAFDLTHVGGPPGGTSVQEIGGMPISLTAGPWVTGPVAVTGITTNVVSYAGITGAAITMRLTPDEHAKVLSTAGGFVTTNGGLPLEAHTITLSGENELLSANVATTGSGWVTLVAPMRLNTNPLISGRMPGAAWMTLSFVPEPGSMLLLVSGALALAMAGRRRLRR